MMPLAQIDQTLCSLISDFVIACTNLFSDENGGSIGKSAEKGDDQSFQSTEDGDSGDSLLALTTENYIDQHISDTDKYFITDDRETFFQVLFT